MASTSVTATVLIKNSLDILGVYAVGESLGASEAATGLRTLNAMMSSLAIENLTVPTIVRSVFDIVANDGSYTIGDGADFNTIRPTFISHASLLLNSSSPAVEVPLTVLTDQAYQMIAIKSQTSEQPTAVYYNPTFTTFNWGTITLWPVPTTATNDLVLYYPQPLTEFTNLTTTYQVPPGYEEMLNYNLAVRLAAPFARRVEEDVRRLASQSLARIKRTNTKMVDLYNDAALIGSRSHGYNIESDGYN